MRQVRIAELKAGLSGFLRSVQQGESITVLDRNTVVAQIIPAPDRPALRIRKPARGSVPLNQIALPPPMPMTTGVVSLLLEERQNHR